MTIYIRNPHNSQGTLTDSNTHNFVASAYEPVTQYSSEDDGVTYLQATSREAAYSSREWFARRDVQRS